MSLTERTRQTGTLIKSQGRLLGSIVLAFWVIELADWLLFRGALDQFGIAPRRLLGLRGLILAPFLHLDFGHLLANTIPFLILGWLVLLQKVRTFLQVSIIVAIVGGLGVWLLGPSGSVHIGASGLIFGYLGYLLARGYYVRSWQAISLAVGVGIFYGGLLWGVLPQGNGISWQGHLFGFAAGCLAAWWLSDSRRLAN